MSVTDGVPFITVVLDFACSFVGSIQMFHGLLHLNEIFADKLNKNRMQIFILINLSLYSYRNGSLPMITVDFIISSIHPAGCSSFGGCVFTISGTGLL